jgi:hypothetical protein
VGFRPRSFFSSGAPPRLGASQHRTQDTSCPSSSEPRTAPPGFCILLSALPVLIYDPRAVPQGDPRRRPAPRLPGRSPPPPRSRPRQRPAQRCCCRSGPRCPHEGEVRLGRAIEAARPCRRGDRISDAFAAMHMSPIGTKRTCSPRRSMSAFGGKADIDWAVLTYRRFMNTRPTDAFAVSSRADSHCGNRLHFQQIILL